MATLFLFLFRGIWMVNWVNFCKIDISKRNFFLKIIAFCNIFCKKRNKKLCISIFLCNFAAYFRVHAYENKIT